LLEIYVFWRTKKWISLKKKTIHQTQKTFKRDHFAENNHQSNISSSCSQFNALKLVCSKLMHISFILIISKSFGARDKSKGIGRLGQLCGWKRRPSRKPGDNLTDFLCCISWSECPLFSLSAPLCYWFAHAQRERQERALALCVCTKLRKWWGHTRAGNLKMFPWSSSAQINMLRTRGIRAGLPLQ